MRKTTTLIAGAFALAAVPAAAQEPDKQTEQTEVAGEAGEGAQPPQAPETPLGTLVGIRAAYEPLPRDQVVYHASDLPYPFSDAVQVGDVLYLSGDIGANDEGTGPVPGGIEAETRRIFERMEQRLARHKRTFDDVFKCTVMLADMAEWPAFNAVYAEHFKQGRFPARSAMGVNGLALGARVEVECMAHNPVAPSYPGLLPAYPPYRNQVIGAPLGPPAGVIGGPALDPPYDYMAKRTLMPQDDDAREFMEKYGFSEAVFSGDTLYLSGVIAGPPSEDMTREEAYDRAFQYIESVLKRAGVGWNDVVDITTYHVDIDASMPAFAEVKNRYIKAPFPAWTAIDVDRLYEPEGEVEIKITARLLDSPYGYGLPSGGGGSAPRKGKKNPRGRCRC